MVLGLKIPNNDLATNLPCTQNPEPVKILSVKSSKLRTLVGLDKGTQVSLRPYIYLNVGDVLEFWPSKSNIENVYKIVGQESDEPFHRIRIHPAYSKSSWIAVPPHKFLVTFRERAGPSDSKATKILEQFHYRGKGLNRIVGRRTALVAETREHGIIGYGVVSATLAAAKPRFALFDTNFREQMNSKLINRLVRIPRVVIHPEFRGMGLGVLMTKHLVDYVREYWDIRGYTPIAVEVVASMTEYHRFFEAAGFIRTGETLGYEKGIAPMYGTGTWEKRPNSATYDFIGHQKPKPYLIYPLNSFVRGVLMEKGKLGSDRTKLKSRPKVKATPIILRRVSAEYRVTNGSTPRAEQVRDAFDVDSRQMNSPVLKNLFLNIDPGNVVLITGASGSGKSTILRLLSEDLQELRENMDISGTFSGLDHKSAARLTRAWDDTRPLIDQIGSSVKEAIEVLNSVGLAEAHLYVKRPFQISDGQRYRFAVALLCDSKKPLWIADEFTSALDPLTAAIVAKGIRKRAYYSGATLVIAAPHIQNFVDSLVPNTLVALRWGGIAEIVSIRCRYRVFSGFFELRIKNTGKQVLTDVNLSSIAVNGDRQVIAKVGSLGPQKRSEVVVLPLSEVEKFSGLVVMTQQHVGDIVYFNDYLKNLDYRLP